jgi:hypothetical protein
MTPSNETLSIQHQTQESLSMHSFTNPVACRPQRTMIFPGLFGLLVVAFSGLTTPGQEIGELLGRWDLTVQGESGNYPSWLEVRKSGHRTLVGSFVGQFGSARPISEVTFDGEHLRFQIPPQWEDRTSHLVFEGKLSDGKLSGGTNDGQGNNLKWTGVRAPDLKRERAPEWGKSVEIFNGKDTTGWHARFEDRQHGWEVIDGVLSNVRPGIDLVTDQKFEDFKLHVEFRYPQGSNSGIYLRGRYEVQIEDNFGDEPESHKIGGVYGFLTPSINAAKEAGEWQSMDITLVGRVLTVVFNGERVIDRQTIPGITGGALDNKEGEPGPLMIQGDHGPVEFRKIEITTPVE